MELSFTSRVAQSWRRSRLAHAFNAFMNRDPTSNYRSYGVSSSQRPDRVRLTRGGERSIVNSIFNRIALDVAQINIRHCLLDDNDRFIAYRNSYLNNCLSVEANIDQTAKAFIHDVVMSMLDEGHVAIVPVDATSDPRTTTGFDVISMRTGKIIEWFPQHVKVRVYNDKNGQKEEIILPKKSVCIIENPLYSIVNEPNSMMQRLIRKLSLLDQVDEQSSAGKLDMIIQLPYVIKTEARRNEANRRRKEIEEQLASSKYGIAYADGTERITQINRPLENNLLKQVEYLTELVFGQIGMTQAILNGTANEQEQLSYQTRCIEPFVFAIVDELKRKFLTKTARSQKQTIMAFRDPFKLVPINNIAEIADKFTRNEILTSNEIRQIIGMKPSDDPKADQLVNSNISQPNQNGMIGDQGYTDAGYEEGYDEGYEEDYETEEIPEEGGDYINE